MLSHILLTVVMYMQLRAPHSCARVQACPTTLMSCIHLVIKCSFMGPVTYW